MPNEPRFETLYDLAQVDPPNLLFLALSAVAFAVALGALIVRRRKGQKLNVAVFFTAAFALVLAVSVLSVWDHHRLQQALRDGHSLVVQGLLQSHTVQQRAAYNPSTKRYDRSIAESFYIADVPFGFVRDGSAAGFTNSGDAVVELVNGQVLRVRYVEDTPGDFASRRILRVERLVVPAADAATRAGNG
ncbi:MAG: hypothetical protein ABI574_08365 [Burkholderiales bacterium]